MILAVPRVMTMPARDLWRAWAGLQPPTSVRYFSLTRWKMVSAKSWKTTTTTAPLVVSVGVGVVVLVVAVMLVMAMAVVVVVAVGMVLVVVVVVVGVVLADVREVVEVTVV